jgi:hypothetical protein
LSDASATKNKSFYNAVTRLIWATSWTGGLRISRAGTNLTLPSNLEVQPPGQSIKNAIKLQRETDRQIETDRQAGRQRERERDRQTDRDKLRRRETDGGRERQTDRQTETN